MAPFRALGAASAAAAVAAAAVAAAATAVAATPTPTPPSAAAATVEAATAAGVAYFARRCAEQRPLLVGLRNAIGRGDLAAARTAYIASRPPYEEIETLANVPVVTPLDTRIDARPYAVEGGEDAVEWQGFHEVERALYRDASLQRAYVATARLQASVETLCGVLDAADPEQFTPSRSWYVRAPFGLMRRFAGLSKGGSAASAPLDLLLCGARGLPPPSIAQPCTHAPRALLILFAPRLRVCLLATAYHLACLLCLPTPQGRDDRARVRGAGQEV